MPHLSPLQKEIFRAVEAELCSGLDPVGRPLWTNGIRGHGRYTASSRIGDGPTTFCMITPKDGILTVSFTYGFGAVGSKEKYLRHTRPKHPEGEVIIAENLDSVSKIAQWFLAYFLKFEIPSQESIMESTPLYSATPSHAEVTETCRQTSGYGNNDMAGVSKDIWESYSPERQRVWIALTRWNLAKPGSPACFNYSQDVDAAIEAEVQHRLNAAVAQTTEQHEIDEDERDTTG